MALDDSALSGLLESLKAGDGVDVFREIMQLGLQALIEAEVTEHIGAARHERTESRTNQRNGSRARLLSTKAGDVQLGHPQAGEGLVLPLVARAAPTDRSAMTTFAGALPAR